MESKSQQKELLQCPSHNMPRYLCECADELGGLLELPPNILAETEFTMPFGKYAGKTIAEISQINPGYLKWVVENFEEGKVKSLVLEFLKKK